MTRLRWTEDEVRLITEAYAARRSVSSIAEELGRTRIAVVDKAWRLNISPNRTHYTPTEEHLMIEWRKAGWTCDQIAAELGKTRGAIKQKLWRMRA